MVLKQKKRLFSSRTLRPGTKNDKLINNPAIEWLWKAKQKSRASFLMILSFIYLPRKGYSNLLVCLKPHGL
jgi:hypothetical protein